MAKQNTTVACLLVLVLTSLSSGAVIFVDNRLPNDCLGTYSIARRDNSGADGTAYNTAQKAANASRPGDTIYFRAGTYYGSGTQSATPVMKILTSGTVQAPITYRNYGQEEAILSGQIGGVPKRISTVELGTKPSDTQVVSGQGVQNIILEGLIITDATYQGLAIWGPANQLAPAENPTQNVIVRHVIARNNRGGNGYGMGIHTAGKLVDCVIDFCEAYHNTGAGIFVGRVGKTWHATEPEDSMSAAHRCIVRNCLAYANAHPAYPGNTDGIAMSNGYRCRMEDNVVFGNSDDGMDIYASIECLAQNNIIFSHNTVGGNNCGLKFSAGGGGRHTLAGNVVFDNLGYGFEGSKPSNPLRVYYPSRLYSNLGHNCALAISLGQAYDVNYPGYAKTLIRDNLLFGNTNHDIFYGLPQYTESDYNFFSDAGDLATMRGYGLDAHSLTGSPQLTNLGAAIDTNFGADWSIEQKLESVRSQVKAKFSPSAGGNLVDAGTRIDGYHNLNPGDNQGTGEAWYGSAPDIGAYEYALTSTLYNLVVTAVNGSVAKTPNKTSYSSGETVALQAAPNAGYAFAGWSGDLTGTSNSAILVMNANKSVTANFTGAIAYALTISATNGSVTRTPNKTAYSSGETVTLQATPRAGYKFAGWSGDLTGTSNPVTLVMNASKSVTANFTAITYTLTVSAANGSVAKTPNKTAYSSGETVTLQATPRAGYKFAGWSGDLTGTNNPATLVMNANKSVTANFPEAIDQSSPVLGDCSPAPDSIQTPPDTLVILHLRDEDKGVEAASVSIRVDGILVYQGDVDSYSTASGVCYRSGTPADFTYRYQGRNDFEYSREVLVAVNARDLAGNVMPEQTYSFDTEMYAFGRNRTVCPGQSGLDQGGAATTCDGQGNLWIVWHAGSPGQRQIYAARYLPDSDSYRATMQVSRSTGDHCNPAVAADGAGTLYVVWQENSGDTWDVCASQSADGKTWSLPVRLVKSVSKKSTVPVNRVNPVVVAGQDSSRLVAFAWQDNQAGNQNIYVAKSTDQLQTITISRVTSNTADQVDPALALDGQNTIFVLWTDSRNGSRDVYGAASNRGPWANVPVVRAAGNQFQAAVAAEPGGQTLHIAWVDDASGNPDVFYGTSVGLPARPLTGSNLVDDTSAADQQGPALSVASVSGTTRVFVCWEDGRNLPCGGGIDLYFADVGADSLRTNVLVDDEGTAGNQRGVALGADRWGYPYLVWADDANTVGQLYYAGATYANPASLAKKQVLAVTGGVVGTPPEEITTLNDVSVVLPAQACPFDATISIRGIKNPQEYLSTSLRYYEFVPSGLTFAQPVTITIPYTGTVDSTVKACWFNAVTGTFSEQGVTDIEYLTIQPGLYALRFKTTHFTPFYLVSAEVPPKEEAPNASGRAAEP